MRVVHWNQIQLVDQEPDSDLQLASRKNCLACSCICFGRAVTGIESPSHLKVSPTKQQPRDDLKRFLDSEKVSKMYASDLNSRNVGSLKSSLKGPATVVASIAANECGDTERKQGRCNGLMYLGESYLKFTN